MEKLEKFGAPTVFGRPGQPAELASIYVQLACLDASFTTGAVYGCVGCPRPALSMSKPTPLAVFDRRSDHTFEEFAHTHEGMGTYVCLGNLSLASWADCAIPRWVPHATRGKCRRANRHERRLATRIRQTAASDSPSKAKKNARFGMSEPGCERVLVSW